MISRHILIACGILSVLSTAALAGTTPSHAPNTVARPTGSPAQGGQPNAHGYFENMAPGSAARPAGSPAQGGQPNAHGYFENMAPVAHDDAEHAGHEPAHPVGGGGKATATQGSAVQQQQPPAPAKFPK